MPNHVTDPFADLTGSIAQPTVAPTVAPAAPIAPQGADPFAALANFATPAPSVTAPDNIGVLDSFGRGFSRGIQQEKNFLTNVAVLGTQAVGATAASQSLIDTSQQQTQALSDPKYQTVPFSQALDSVGNAAKWFAGALGEQIPNMATIIASGGVGSLIAKTAVKVGTKELTAAAVNKAMKLGAEAGAFAGASTIETGATAGEQLSSVGKVDPVIALGAGLAKGVLESVTPIAIGRASGILKGGENTFLRLIDNTLSDPRGLAARAGTSFLKTGGMEAATEAAQEAVDVAARVMVDKNYDGLGADAKQRIVESAVTAFFVGGALGGVTAAATGRRKSSTLLSGPEGNAPAKVKPGDSVKATQGVTSTANGPAAVQGPPEMQGPPIPPLALPAPASPVQSQSPMQGPPEMQGPKQGQKQGQKQRKPRSFLSLFGNKVANIPKPTAPTSTSLSALPVDQLRRTQQFPQRLGLFSFIHKSEIGKATPLLEFHPGHKTAVLAGRAGKLGDPNEFYFLEAGKNLQKRDTTALLEHLPAKPADLQSTVKFSNPQTAGEALQLAQKAIELRNAVTLQEVKAAPPGAPYAEARKLYAKAINLGLRVPPEPHVGFIAVPGVQKASDVRVVTAPPMPSPMSLSASQGLMLDTTVLDPTNGRPVNSDINKYPVWGLLPIYPALNINTAAASQGRVGLFDRFLELSIKDRPVEQIYDPKAKSSTADGSARFADELFRDVPKGTARVFFTTHNSPKKHLADKTSRTARHITRTIKFLSKLADSMMSTFFKEQKLALVFSYNDVVKSSGAYFGSAVEGYNVIYINLRELAFPKVAVVGGQTVTMARTLVHEFGHMLGRIYFHKFTDTHPEIVVELVQAYRRDLARASQPDLSKGFARFNSPLSELPRFGGLLPQDATLPQLIKNTGESFVSYVLSYEEWMAEQMAVWFADPNTDRQPLGMLGKFMQQLARRVNRLFKYAEALISPREMYKASDAFKAFVEEARSKTPNETDGYQALLAAKEAQRVEVKELGASVIPGEDSPGLNVLANNNILRGILKDKRADDGTPMAEKLRLAGLAKDHFNSIVKWGWTILQLADKNKHIQKLQEYVSLARQWSNEKMFWASRANDTLREWGSLGKERADKLAEFIFAMDSMVYLEADEKPRHPTDAETQAMVERFGLDEATYQLYMRIRSDFNAMLDRLEGVVLTNIRKNTPLGSLAQVTELFNARKEFSAMRNRPYFPHARFGKYMVVVKNKSGAVVYAETVEGGGVAEVAGRTPRKVRLAGNKLRKMFPSGKGFTVKEDIIPEQSRVFQGMPLAALKLIKEHLGAQMTAEQNIWLDQMVIAAAPSTSFRKHLGHRSDVAGYSKDAMRAYADYFWHGANHMARISFGQDMRDKIAEMDKETSKLGDLGNDIIKRRRIVSFMTDHLDNLLNPQADWAQLRSVAFTWWLGFSPASAVLNFTQIPLVTAPYLSAQFGDLRALGALRRAMVQLKRTYVDPVKNLKGLTGEKLQYQKMLNKLLDLGFKQNFLTESLAVELAGTAAGGVFGMTRYGSNSQRIMSGFANAAGWLFQGSEKINRRVSFAAAVELATKNPDSKYLIELRAKHATEFTELMTVNGLSRVEATAFLAGRDVVTKTQFEYSAWARPRFMRGRKSVIFTFYMFTQNMLWFTFNSAGNKRMLLTMLAMGGLMGMPGAEDLFSLADFLGRKIFGKYFSIEEEIARLMTELFGSNQTGDLLLHGASRVGFGIPAAADMVGLPLPVIDMSGSIGLGRVVPGVQALTQSGSGTFEQKLGKATTDIAGASLGIGLNLFKFLSDSQLPLSDPKRWERVVPRSLKNVIKAARLVPPDSSVAALTGNFIAPEGRERSRTGNTIVSFDGNNPEQMLEIAAQAMGFNPTRVSREWSNIIAVNDAVTFWKLRRQTLVTQFWHSLYTGDKQERDKVLKLIKEFNKSSPSRSMFITGDTLRRSVARRKTIMLQRARGQQQSSMFQGVADSVDRVLPSQNDVVLSETVR